MENSYIVPETTLTEIADAIREKTGGTDDIAIEDFAESIRDIEGAGKTSFSYFTVDCRADEFIYYVEGMTWQEFANSILNDYSYISWAYSIPLSITISDNEVTCSSHAGMRHRICNVQSTDRILQQQYECEYIDSVVGEPPLC